MRNAGVLIDRCAPRLVAAEECVMRCSVQGCVNRTLKTWEGKPMCARCVEEVEALSQMYEAARFEKQYKAELYEWERRHIQLAKKRWTPADLLRLVFVLGALAYLGFTLGAEILLWLGAV